RLLCDVKHHRINGLFCTGQRLNLANSQVIHIWAACQHTEGLLCNYFFKTDAIPSEKKSKRCSATYRGRFSLSYYLFLQIFRTSGAEDRQLFF
ncbi:MAG TPA: hypothetical protein VFC65_16010, partial [Prolixibacteraceae bacterium]|nr:hypothetical protein [Prolixibacteraceae bacterium]